MRRLKPEDVHVVEPRRDARLASDLVRIIQEKDQIIKSLQEELAKRDEDLRRIRQQS